MDNNYFIKYFKNEIEKTKEELSKTYSILKNYTLVVSDEQNIVQENQMKPNYIFVVLKKMSSTIVYATLVQNYQIWVLSEENGLEVSKLIFDEFAITHNYLIKDIDEDNKFKQEYTEAAIMQNFTDIGVGYRSLLSISAIVCVMQKMVDVNEIKVDDEVMKMIHFSFNYGMTCDTQPFQNSNFASSVKSVQMATFSLTIPSAQSNIMSKIQKIFKSEISGNTTFNLKIKFNNQDDYFEYSVKLISADFVTAPNSMPALELGFSL